jgi:hypothetical protein
MKADYHKITQALCYLGSKCRGRTMDKLHALKVVYLADRYHLRKYGSTISSDNYLAMEMGPVASTTRKTIEGKLSGDPAAYALQYITPGKDRFQSKISTSFDELSKTDIESLDAAYDTYLAKGPDNIIAFTHRFPEWQKHQREIDAGKKAVRMSLVDFFDPSHFPKDEYCPADEELVETNKEIFLETPEYLRS